MKNRFVAFILMIVMIVCSAYIGGYRSLSQLKDEVVDIDDIATYNLKAQEFNDILDDSIITNIVAKAVGISRLELK